MILVLRRAQGSEHGRALAIRRRDGAIQPWGPALAICGAFAAAFVKLKGIYGGFPPADAQTWLVYLGVPVVLAAVVTTVWSKRAAWVSYACGSILAAAVAGRVVRDSAWGSG